ncbi:MAG: hypothetical protein J6R04_05135 [Clostridia bacterium]|nr:hypothetical protein [Clostridia bacterium]
MPEQPTPEVVDGKYILFNGDAVLEGMTTASVTVNTDKKYIVEGEGSIKTTEHTDRLVYTFEPKDLSAYLGGYLHLSVYVSDISTLGSSYVELTSSGGYDVNEMTWALKDTYLIKNGWNEIWLNLTMGQCAAGNEIDLTAVNYFRLYTNRTKGAPADDFYIDDVYLSMEKLAAPALPGEVVSGEKTMLLDCDAVSDGVLNVELNTDATYVKQGAGSLKTVQGNERIIYSFDPLDITAYDGGYLHMWVYVSDMTIIPGGQIELCSGGTCDSGEMRWSFKDNIKQNGWNELWLKVTTDNCAAATGITDLKGVNYLRVYTGNAAELQVYFDDIYFALTNE